MRIDLRLQRLVLCLRKLKVRLIFLLLQFLHLIQHHIEIPAQFPDLIRLCHIGPQLHLSARDPLYRPDQHIQRFCNASGYNEDQHGGYDHHHHGYRDQVDCQRLLVLLQNALRHQGICRQVILSLLRLKQLLLGLIGYGRLIPRLDLSGDHLVDPVIHFRKASLGNDRPVGIRLQPDIHRILRTVFFQNIRKYLAVHIAHHIADLFVPVTVIIQFQHKTDDIFLPIGIIIS